MEPHTYSVTELGREIGRVVDAAFPTEVWVRGEIRNLSRPPSGHVYFDLVDPDRVDAVLPVALLRANKAAVNVHMTRSGAGRMVDGTEVRIGGFVAYFPTRGVVQLRMTRIDAEYTLGRLAAAREELLRRLAAAGLLDRNARLAMPDLPLRVGLVTSAGSAAEADFLGELGAGGHAFSVVVADARVSGGDAAASLVAALGLLARRPLDVVALVRGGGSRTDLAAFDSEELARAIAAAPVPVVTGIGHEVDETIADRVAHSAFKTPTACAAALRTVAAGYAERVERAWAGIAHHAGRRVAAEAEQIGRLGLRVARATRHGLRVADGGLAAARHRLEHAVQRRLAFAGSHLDNLAGRAAGEARAGVRAAEALVDSAAARVRALDPAAVLARGWSITRGPDGRALRSVASLEPDTEIVTVLADGQAGSRVAWVEEAGG